MTDQNKKTRLPYALTKLIAKTNFMQPNNQISDMKKRSESFRRTIADSKGRFCNTIASVALVHTSIQSDKRMQIKEILSSRNSKQTKPQSCPETSTANSRLVRAKAGFLEKVLFVCLFSIYFE